MQGCGELRNVSSFELYVRAICILPSFWDQDKLEMTDSDKNFTTMASITFNRLLRDIQSSNLNFQLQVVLQS